MRHILDRYYTLENGAWAIMVFVDRYWITLGEVIYKNPSFHKADTFGKKSDMVYLMNHDKCTTICSYLEWHEIPIFILANNESDITLVSIIHMISVTF